MQKTSQRFCWVFCFGVMFASGAAMAAGLEECPAGQYNAVYVSGEAGTIYTCVSCPAKFPYSDGGTIVIDSCYVTKNGCGTGCRLYHNGTSNCTDRHPEYGSDGLLHCLSQTRDCRDFELSPKPNINARFGNLGQWQQLDQIGNAVWNGSSWVSDGCRLQRTVSNLTTYSQAACTEGVIWRYWPDIVWDASRGYYNVNYNNGVDWYYCTKCGAGKSPVILSSGEAFDLWGCERLEGTNPYLACSCKNVADGFYSTGCTIEYPLYGDEIPIDCKCGSNAGLTLSTGGDFCVPDGTTQYCDTIGCFTLGTGGC